MFHKIFITLFFFLLLPGVVVSQGLVFDDDSYNKVSRLSLYGDGSKSENKALDSIFKVDLKPYCPRVQYQGTIGSCVGWSLGYGAHTIQNAILNEWADQKNRITEQAFSAMFIFNQIKLTDCNFGARIEDGLELMKNKGNLLSQAYDSDPEDCFKIPSEEQLAQAGQFKILDYFTLFGPDDQKGIKINKTKISLMQNRPVVVGMEIKKNFYNIKRGEEYWFPNVGNTDPGGGHAMVVVGFDDIKKAFEIMNSWGELWGNDGFIWVNYDDFADYCKYGFQFKTKETVDFPSVCFGKLNLRKPVIRTRDTIVFSNLALSFKDSHYELEENQLNKGQSFQFEVSGVSSGTYLYCFSLGTEGDLKIHWPRDERIDNKFDGVIESALISVPEVELIIPGPYTALQINNSGTEHICFLFTTEPIKDLNDKLKRFSKSKQPIKERLKSAFGKKSVAFDQTSYNESEISFLGHLKPGQIIPLVIAIDIE